MADHSSSSSSSSSPSLSLSLSLKTSTATAVPCILNTAATPPASSASPSRSLPTSQDSRLVTIESSSDNANAPIESRTRLASPSASSSPTKVARLGIQSSGLPTRVNPFAKLFSSSRSGPGTSADHNQSASSAPIFRPTGYKTSAALPPRPPRARASFQAQAAHSRRVLLLGVDISNPPPRSSTQPFFNTGTDAAPSAPVFYPASAAAARSSLSGEADQGSLTAGVSSRGTKLPSENYGTSTVEKERANAIADWDKEVTQANNAVETFAAAHTTFTEHITLLDGYQQEVEKALESIEKQYESMCEGEHNWLRGHDAAATREAMYVQVESIRNELKQMQERAKSALHTTQESYQLGEIRGLRWRRIGLVVSILNEQLTLLNSFDETAQALSTRIEELGAQATIYQDQ